VGAVITYNTAIPGYGVFFLSPSLVPNALISQLMAVGSTSNAITAPVTVPQHATAHVVVSRQENVPTTTGMLPARAPNPITPIESQTQDVHKPLPPTLNAQSAVKKDPEESEYLYLSHFIYQFNILLVDSHNWPDGEVRQRFLTGEELPDYKESKWVWRSMGNKRFDGVHSTTYSCQGVLHCPNPDCHRPICRRTCTRSRSTKAPALFATVAL
jgi:hypothetical protein